MWRFLAGSPLRARDVSREQITRGEGLSALSLDALMPVAYGPEAIIVVLAAAGAGALYLVVDFRGVPWGCGELAIVGQQGEAEGLGECDVHRVIGAEVVPHLEGPRL